MKKWIRKKAALGCLKIAFKMYKLFIKRGKTPYRKFKLHCMVRQRKLKDGRTMNEFINWMIGCEDDDIKYLGALWQAYDIVLLANIMKELGMISKVEAE